MTIGDTVRIVWTGYAGVPKWLNLSTATVIKIGRNGSLTVKAHEEIGGPDRRIKSDQWRVIR